MKKFLLSFILIGSVTMLTAQPVCPVVTSIKGNNGGGNCPDLSNGGQASGSITVCFSSAVTMSTAPEITCVYDNTANQPVQGITFKLFKITAQGCAIYCYYEGPNKINNLFGAGTDYTLCTSFPTGANCKEQSPLPVTFRYFNATRNKSSVAVKWTTASESNARGFYVQRNTKGVWENVTYVPSAGQAGNSSTDLNYSYNDVNNVKGVSQYRIQQIDLDSRARVTDVRAVRGEQMFSKLIVYPNPSTDGKTNIVFDDNASLRDVTVSDMSGRLVKQWKGVSNNNLVIENLQSGFYSVRVFDRTTLESTVEKLVIKKR
jgi:hypothetical protein